MITTVVLLIHVFLALGLVALILLQHGKGADAGAAFGSGASATVFGSQGASSFMTRATKWLAIMFFITSGSLAYLSQGVRAPTESIMDAQPVQTVPADEQSDEESDDLPPASDPAVDQQADDATGDIPAVDAAESDTADDTDEGDGGNR